MPLPRIRHKVYIKAAAIEDTGLSSVIHLQVEYRGTGITEVISQSAYGKNRYTLIQRLRWRIRMRAAEIYGVSPAQIDVEPKLEDILR